MPEGRKIEITFIRNGQTISNLANRFLGSTDEPLCKEGKDALLGKRRFYPEAEMLFSGPMVRCVDTAEILFPDMELEIILAWTEIEFGKFEKKSPDELSDDEDYKKWLESGRTMFFPDGESREIFVERTMAGFEYMLGMVYEKGAKRVSAVVHSGTIMAILSSLCGGDYFDYYVENGEGYRFAWDGAKITELEKVGVEI